MNGMQGNKRQGIAWSVVAWLAVGLFWLLTTRRFHPLWSLALIATGALVTAYAAASYINHLILIPRYLRAGLVGRYLAILLGVMAVFTGLALAVLRTAYVHALGPGSVNTIGTDFGIDLFGMAVHLLGAAGVVWAARSFIRHR